ncbi:hypothetical protein [Magnetospira sp. QH-2]|uniref:hypothetical protein n=1 Tax=Magnetospira sp. (strain QH-2) TaxID=1288970 RepID=UPI0003E80D9B|nr:hypothetical protein [Magnetospira sp. QH-2]CCQ75744.1 Protein of unknown function [Magnetospira sp. QH-2]
MTHSIQITFEDRREDRFLVLDAAGYENPDDVQEDWSHIEEFPGDTVFFADRLNDNAALVEERKISAAQVEALTGRPLFVVINDARRIADEYERAEAACAH